MSELPLKEIVGRIVAGFNVWIDDPHDRKKAHEDFMQLISAYQQLQQENERLRTSLATLKDGYVLPEAVEHLRKENERLKYAVSMNRGYEKRRDAEADEYVRQIASLTAKLEAVGHTHEEDYATNKMLDQTVIVQAERIRSLESLLRDSLPWQLPPSLQDRIRAALPAKREDV